LNILFCSMCDGSWNGRLVYSLFADQNVNNGSRIMHVFRRHLSTRRLTCDICRVVTSLAESDTPPKLSTT